MRLIELDPKWQLTDDSGKRLALSFDCPHCREVKLRVVFHHLGNEATDDRFIHAHEDAKFIWTESGDDFDKVTITPSIDASHAGHWHGFITNGECR